MWRVMRWRGCSKSRGSGELESKCILLLNLTSPPQEPARENANLPARQSLPPRGTSSTILEVPGGPRQLENPFLLRGACKARPRGVSFLQPRTRPALRGSLRLTQGPAVHRTPSLPYPCHPPERPSKVLLPCVLFPSSPRLRRLPPCLGHPVTQPPEQPSLSSGFSVPLQCSTLASSTWTSTLPQTRGQPLSASA